MCVLPFWRILQTQQLTWLDWVNLAQILSLVWAAPLAQQQALTTEFEKNTKNQGNLKLGTCLLGMDICFFTFRMDFKLIGWPPQPQIFSSSSTKITKKMQNFELQFWNAGGCLGYPLSSKSILKVKKQMSLPKQHVHISFLTPWIAFVGILVFQIMALRYQSPCRLCAFFSSKCDVKHKVG